MGTPIVYPQHKLRQYNGTAVVDLDTDDIRVFIVSGAYAYNAAHDFIDDLTNHVTGTGAPGVSGLAVTGKTYTLDGAVGEFVHDDIVIPQNAAGFANGRTIVWAKWTGTAATSPLIQYMTEASDFGNVDGPLTFDGSAATGVLAIS
ncbi:MAG TPA: hypothetical protein VF628_02410 [Allosphingosinicella sp.]|jgi:hypothetical protein